jgi:hypothetical protein
MRPASICTPGSASARFDQRIFGGFLEHMGRAVCPDYFGATNGRVRTVDASAIRDGGRLHGLATNRSLAEGAPLRIRVADGQIRALESAEVMTG